MSLVAILTYPHLGNISYYKCDVSKWEEIKAVSEKIVNEVCFLPLWAENVFLQCADW